MPEQELTDLRIVGEDIILNEQGDVDLVSGFENVKQSVALDVRDVTNFQVGSFITETAIYEIQNSITQSLINDPQVSNPISVSPSLINTEENEIEFEVTLQDNNTFTLDLVLPE